MHLFDYVQVNRNNNYLVINTIWSMREHETCGLEYIQDLTRVAVVILKLVNEWAEAMQHEAQSGVVLFQTLS